MKILGLQLGKKIDIPTPEPIINTGTRTGINDFDIKSNSYGFYSNLMPVSYNGEKTPYELGTPLSFELNYYQINIRAWEFFLKSDVVQNAIRKYCLWVVGSGLKLDSTPNLLVLKKYKINVDEKKLKTFQKDAESQFRLFLDQSESVYNNQHNFHEEAAETLKNALLSGDILCINRFDGKNTSIETVDGQFVQTPIMTDDISKAEKRGHKIVDGVELDKKGKHIAYYVKQADTSYKKILANGSRTGRKQAWLMYGMKYKKTSIRGMSLLSAIMETVKKMDNFKSATLKGAEENAKIPYTIEHDQFSTGENPLIDQLAQSFGKGKGTALETHSANCDAKATKIATTVEGQVYNMPIGATLKRNVSSSDFHFESFWTPNLQIVYSTLGIPPQVALDIYDTSYSSSRAAIKSWEYKLKTDRKNIMTRQFYKPFYDLWLEVAILKNMVQAPGYIGGDFMVQAAYNSARFIGAGVPHIDPLKEVKAEREKLGPAFDNIPLGTVEGSMENLNTGDFDSIISKSKTEYEEVEYFTVDDPVDDNGGNTDDIDSSISDT